MNDYYDVFISYRREGGKEHARTIQQALEKKYRVFLDFDELIDGIFDQRIMDAISHSSVFILLLTKDALDRCINEDDWVRKEILYAAKCICHIVPVTIDNTFEGIPDDLPKEVQDVIGAHQFSEIQTKTLFKSSIDKLIKERIEPYIHRIEFESGTEIHIDTDVDCDLYRFKTFVKKLQAGTDNVVHLKPGNHILEFVSSEYPEVKEIKDYSLSTVITCDNFKVKLKEKVEAKRKAEEEAMRNNKEIVIALVDKGIVFYKNKDYNSALSCFQKAAKIGHASAQYFLGVMYMNGRGVEQSDTEAVKWFRKAAEQGYVYAQFNLGWMYENGRGVEQSDIEAVKWFRKAAEQGSVYAQFNLGNMYRIGRGVEQSDTEAVKWYRKAAEQGYANAVKRLHNVAEQGQALAQNNLGEMYENGRGVEQSDTEAVKWYRKAAEQGYVYAQFNLGEMYENGRGVEQSDTEAVKWYRKAAEQGHVYAQNNLGWMYENGRGVEQSDTEAVKWYREASKNGNQKAKDGVCRLLYKKKNIMGKIKYVAKNIGLKICDFLFDFQEISWKKYLVVFIFMIGYVLWIYYNNPDPEIFDTHIETYSIEVLGAFIFSYLCFRSIDYYALKNDHSDYEDDLVKNLFLTGIIINIALLFIVIGIGFLLGIESTTIGLSLLAITFFTGFTYAILTILEYTLFKE